ncbi:MAG TPA: serine hydrolase domain-containing protein [Pyrinomonadaceae bacterium]|jgi:CubicO group peptidase (beta-lactamase class C family)
MSHDKEYESKGMTRRDFLGGSFAITSSLAMRRSKTTGQPPGREQEVAPPAEFKPVRDFIEEKINKGIVPSLVIKVVKDNRTLWAEAFGYAVIETKRRATLNSIYKIASISKPITVTGLMMLVDKGLVSLDKPANEYLTRAKLRAYVGSPEEMTIRRLANHTSGLPIHENLFYDGSEPLSQDETIRRYGFAAWAPGTRFQYSNLGTAILGFITQDVSRIPWGQFLKRNLFHPLGMKRTFAELPPGHEKEAAGMYGSDLTSQYDYDIAARFVRTGPHSTDHPGGSSMWSSADDLARFAQMHINGGVLNGTRVLQEGSARTMQNLNVESDVPGRRYGVGWWGDTSIGHRSFSHSGGGPGMGAMLSAYPDDNIITVVLTNYFGAMATEVTKRLAQVLFPAARETQREPIERNTTPSIPKPTAALVGTWQGEIVYSEGDIPLRLAIHDDGILEVGFGAMPMVRLNGVTFSESGFVGNTEGVLIRRAGFQGVSVLEFNLRREDNRLVGICDVYAKGYFELAHWVELKKKA